MKRIQAGIIGGAGYTGGELIRLLLHHPQTDIAFVHSKSQAGQPVYSVHRDLIGETDLHFGADARQAADVLFLCLGHGEAQRFLENYPLAPHTRIIDLSQDFRITASGHALQNDFHYSLPEWNPDIQATRHIANPGCFATAIQLALLPLASQGWLNGDVHISATTGSTGAGQSLSDTSHFSWRSNNLSFYKAFEHQHLREINQSIQALQAGFEGALHFIPYRGNFARGIFATLYTELPQGESEVRALYENSYRNHPFVTLSPEPIDLKQVVNTNKCLLYIEKHGNQLMIASCIDNLLKGASGQAVQNMNKLFGLEETRGLKLKALAF